MAVDEGALRELSSADVVAFGAVGFAASTLPVTRAYQRLAEALGGEVDLRPHLDRLLAEGTPAGKAYAATLLDKLDHDAGRAAWRSLATDRAEITTFTGCLMNRTTLAEYAADRLRSG
ncbi:MAG TPA: hypothetical protein VES42_27710 [Pilimelia sp.]|nr:hypothetical protein [Pilimelia sp.]